MCFLIFYSYTAFDIHVEERTSLASKQMLLWMNLSSSSQELALQKNYTLEGM